MSGAVCRTVDNCKAIRLCLVWARLHSQLLFRLHSSFSLYEVTNKQFITAFNYILLSYLIIRVDSYCKKTDVQLLVYFFAAISFQDEFVLVAKEISYEFHNCRGQTTMTPPPTECLQCVLCIEILGHRRRWRISVCKTIRLRLISIF